jgi:hypothetical protein
MHPPYLPVILKLIGKQNSRKKQNYRSNLAMKTTIKVLAVFAVIALTLAAAGYAYAQSQTPPAAPSGEEGTYGPGMMGGSRGMMNNGRGRMGGFAQGTDTRTMPMHDYMVTYFAEALDIEVDTLNEQLAAGETMYSIAQAQGLSDETFVQLMTDARSAALAQMVADGVITQEQADWMLERMAQKQAAGFGSGECPMHNGGGWRGSASQGNN